MMNYAESISFLDSLQSTKIALGIERISAACEESGSPQSLFGSVIVAGTNGKGSTAAFLESIFRYHGMKVGLYTSPHLVDVRERIQIDREMISKEEFAEVVGRLSSFFGRRNSRLTYFEFLTLVAFLYFAEQKVDMAVLEVGLGGRLDATNVATPLVSVITRIGMDHEGYLGRTLEDIAKEKAGIIKEGVPVVTVMQDDPAMNVIRNIAEEKKAMLHVVSPCEVRYKLGLLGRHQYENAALALRAAEIVTSGRWPVTGEQWPKAGNSAVHSLLETALAATSWPGRLEVISKKPIIIIDGAHNPNGAASLARFIKEELKPKKKRIVLLIGIMADKDVEGVVAPLAGVVDEIIATRPPMERAAMAEKIADVAERFGAARVACIEPLEKAIKEARSSLGEDDALVISGSLYMVGEIKKRPVEAMG